MNRSNVFTVILAGGLLAACSSGDINLSPQTNVNNSTNPTARLFEDFSRLATGAASAMNGARGEMEQLVKQRLERYVAEMDFVPREELEAVAAMARKAREQNDELTKRLEALEAKLSDAK